LFKNIKIKHKKSEMNNVNTCEFCRNTFANKYILKNHQQRAKKCVEIQGKIINNKMFECKYCNKKLQYKYSLKKHLNICTSKLNKTKQNELSEMIEGQKKLLDNIYTQKIEIQQKDIELQEYKTKCQQMEREIHEKNNQIIKLQETIEKVALQAKNITNINKQVINLQPITSELLEKSSKNFTLRHFKDGLDGLCNYAIEYPLYNSLRCTDQNRQQFKWIDGDNDNSVIYDNKMYHLSQKLGKSLKERSESLTMEAISEIEREYNQKIIEYSECDDLDRVSFYQEKMIEFKNLYDKYAKNISKLERGDVAYIINKFSKLMSIKLPKTVEKDE
jgi:hypothetical protein